MNSTTKTTRDIGHESPMRQKITVNGTELFADVPAIYGGTGSAPTPHDYLDVALATCKAITVRMIAAKQKIPLEDINITLTSDASKESSEGIYAMELDYELIGDLTDEQRQMLMGAADKYCPVGNILKGNIKANITERLV